MVGRHVQGVDSLGLHVPHEVHEVAAVGLDRVVGQERVADPGDQGPCRDVGIAARGIKGTGQEGFHLGGRRGVAFQEVGPLGQERGAGRRRLGIRCGGTAGRLMRGGMESFLPSYWMKLGT